MIKFLADKDGKRLYGLGLSRGNMDKLLKGQPILIDLDVLAMNAPASDKAGAVFIFGGETEQAMVDELKKQGVDLSGVPVRNFDEAKEQRPRPGL